MHTADLTAHTISGQHIPTQGNVSSVSCGLLPTLTPPRSHNSDYVTHSPSREAVSPPCGGLGRQQDSQLFNLLLGQCFLLAQLKRPWCVRSRLHRQACELSVPQFPLMCLHPLPPQEGNCPHCRALRSCHWWGQTAYSSVYPSFSLEVGAEQRSARVN